MNINELFDNLQDEDFQEQLKGELILEGNCIIWTFDIKNAENENEQYNTEDEDEFSFDAVISPEEILQEAYDEDIERIENLIGDIDEYPNWTFSPPDVGETTISFRIF